MGEASGLDPLLWMGLVALAGCVGAIAARAAGWPSAAGGLGAGLLIGSIALAAGSPPPRGNPLWEMPALLATAWLCLLAGAELAAGRARRAASGRVLAGSLVSAACVLAAAWPAAILAGLPSWAAFLAAACCAGGSPLVVVAVCGEARARGAATSHELASSALTSLAALALVLLAMMAWGRVSPMRVAGGIAIGAACGVALLLPLSRLASRASIVPCLIVGVFLMAGAALWLSPAQTSILPLGLAAGWVMMRFLPDPRPLLETMRDLAVAAAVLWTAQAAAAPGGPPGSIASLVAALLAARAVGVFLAGRLMPGPLDRSVPAGVTARMATTASMLMLPMLPMLAQDGRAATIAPALASVTILSQAIGLVALRRALAKAGEVPSQDDPGAWRDRMR